MSKIYGDGPTIDRARKAPAGDRGVYVNFDAIQELPDEFEVVLTSVKYDPLRLEKSFSNVGTKNDPSWMPNPDMMYKIAEACGINGGEISETKPMIEEIDINPMLCKSMSDAPTYQKKNVGRSVSKRSSRMMEDGTQRFSSLCTAEYNVWERCLELWSKEESYTDGYSKPSQYGNKYETPFKRRAHFDSEMKFAHAKAESKAYLKSIRELAGMPTGYKKDDLISGEMVFARVRRSAQVIKMETAARLTAISNGVDRQSAQKQLFAPSQIDEPSLEAAEDIPTDEAYVAEPTLLEVYNLYLDENAITDEKLLESAKNSVDWMMSDTNYQANTRYYSRALENLKKIEEQIPVQFRTGHSLY
jgi:hypothetical protein